MGGNEARVVSDESTHNQRSFSNESVFLSLLPYFEKTPMYRAKLAESGCSLNSIRSLKDIARLPLTTKNDLRLYSPLQRTPLERCDFYAFFSSGGTTGSPTLYVWNEEDVAVQTTCSKRILQSVGTTADDLGLVLAPISLPVMGHCMMRQYTAVGAGFVPFSVRSPEEVCCFLRDFPITSVATLPVAASRLIAYYLYVLGFPPKDALHVRQLLLGGDFLSESRRRHLEQHWNATCHNLYGISEIFGPMAGECGCKSGLHFSNDYIYVEVLDPVTREPVEPGQPGVAVYTTLWKKGSPLLRYWSDDFVTLRTEPCACGQAYPRLRYHGRLADHAYLNGRLVFPVDVEEIIMGHAFGDEYVCTYQDGAVDVTVEPVPDADATTDDLAKALEELMHLHVTVKVEPSGSLDRSSPKPKRLHGFPQLSRD